MPTRLSRNSIFLLVSLLFNCTIVNAERHHLGFGFDNKKESVIIPFASFNNLIIIESVIDEKINSI